VISLYDLLYSCESSLLSSGRPSQRNSLLPGYAGPDIFFAGGETPVVFYRMIFPLSFASSGLLTNVAALILIYVHDLYLHGLSVYLHYVADKPVGSVHFISPANTW